MKKWRKGSITKRWIINTLGVFLVIIVLLVTSLSFAIQSFFYNGIQQTIAGRSNELTNFFICNGKTYAAAPDSLVCLIELFLDLRQMLGRNAAAVVADCYCYRVVTACYLYSDNSA